MFQRLRKLKRSTAITATCALLAAPVVAQTDAQSELALRGLEGQIAALQARGEPNPFELGALQTLRAVEKTLQTRYDYGLGDNALNMPLLRLPVTGRANPRAKPAGPEVLTTIFETFLADMDAVRVTLDQAKTAGAAPFTLKLDDIWFDVNLNARRDRGEGAIEALGPLLLGRRAMRDLAKQDSPGFEVRFDAADHAWLTAYTHMLSGFGNLYMAFDPTPVFTRLAERREALKQAPRLPEYYDLAEVTAEIATLQAEQTRLKAEIAAVREKRKPIDAEIRELRKTMNTPENRDKRDEINTQIKALRANLDPLRKESSNYVRAERLVRGELRSAKGKLPGGGDTSRQLESFRPTIDALYVLLASLKQQPDAAHIQAAMGHWREMIVENRTFWMLIEAETDNDREWIPNARQTPALPIEIDPEMIDAWKGVLEDAEAVLTGRLLIPHPMLPAGHGISLAHYERYPSPIDLLEVVHGIGFYEHSAKGPMITPQRWQAFNRLARGRGGLFSVYFN